MKSDTGDYAGGIAGNSVSAISNSYSLCNVNAKDYVGGIVGSGYTVKTVFLHLRSQVMGKAWEASQELCLKRAR